MTRFGFRYGRKLAQQIAPKLAGLPYEAVRDELDTETGGELDSWQLDWLTEQVLSV